MSEGWATVENWKSRVSKNHGYNGEKRLRRFLAYLNESEPKLAGLTPDQLIEKQRVAGNGEQYLILDALQRWVNSFTKLRAESKQGYYVSIRSYFDHNRASLPSDKSFIIRSEVEPVRSKLDVDTVKKTVLASKGKYQAIWLIMLQAGLDEEGFTHWNEAGLEATLKQLRDKPEGPIKIELGGRKHTKNIENFYTFFGRDGARLLGAYMRQRGSAPGQIFKEASKKSLQKQWTRTLQRLGYIEQKDDYKGNRYGLNLHRLRGVFRSRWRLSGVDVEVAEFFLGHSPDKLGYDKSPWLDPDWYEEKYAEAQTWLNILSEDPLNVPRREVTELRKQMGALESAKQGQSSETEALKSRLQKQDEINKALLEEITEIKKLLNKEGA
ncbi:MAG: hypothetical protein NTV61_11535 [Candidatus Bathyarchaeota archaeon]|nr:hypothetical protein [Candidatus Bathyarchaeota archaeon]